MRIICLGLLLVSIFLSCKEDKGQPLSNQGKTTYEVTEIYNVIMEEGEHKAGDLRYKEHNEYHGEQLYGTIYYDRDGGITGKAIMLYEEGDLPTGARYVDPQDSLQSYYKYLYDDEGRKSQVFAYDPVNNEILREERFFYGPKGNLKSKQIMDDQGKLRQRFNWTYDAYGNEKSMMADFGDNTPLTTHVHKITRHDDEKRWLEKWTFIDYEPSAYYKIKRR